MKTLIVFLCALSTSALAQINYNSAIQRAHNAVNQTEAASQGHQAPMMPQQPTAQPPVATDPVLAATMQNIASLRGDFDAMSGNFTPKTFTNDLAAAAMAKKPSGDSVDKIARDLQNAIGGNDQLMAQHQKLAQDIHAVFNSSHLAPAQQKMLENDVQKILQGGGVASDKISAVTDDMKALANETK